VAKITKAYKPAVPKVALKSSVAVDSQISGRRIYGFSAEPLNPRDIDVGGAGRSGRHKRQSITMLGGAFATLLENSMGKTASTHPSELVGPAPELSVPTNLPPSATADNKKPVIPAP
jgi:hypothetical protein